ncbi:MAG: hypothetical protein ACI84C_001537, partial [Flavobacteriales bacterium]
DRWNDIVEIYDKALQQSDVSPTFIKFFLENLHKESIRRQTELMNHVKDQ